MFKATYFIAHCVANGSSQAQKPIPLGLSVWEVLNKEHSEYVVEYQIFGHQHHTTFKAQKEAH